jgi:5S rRNA maturation endonuclease (ribonuclease M5)
MPSDLTQFIVAQLRSHGLPAFGAKSKRPNINTFCPTGHDKETASLSIHRHDGRFLCFGCGIKGKNWNHLSNYLNVETLSEEALPDPFLTFTKDLSDTLRKEMQEFELPWDLEPWHGDYVHDKKRGVIIAEETILALEGCNRFDDIYRCPRLFFPVRQYGELMGWVSRRLDKPIEGIPYKRKYMNAPDMKSSKILFPLDEIERWDTEVVVLVEGPLDAVRLINYNIPALAIMGTGNYDEDNRIDLLNIGIERVILAMDSDDAGKKARHVIGPSLSEMFEVSDFYCPHKKDPGNMGRSYMNRLWRLTRSS